MILLKQNANLFLLVDDKGHILAAGNKLPFDESYHNPPTVTIQRKGKQTTGVLPLSHATYFIYVPKLQPI